MAVRQDGGQHVVEFQLRGIRVHRRCPKGTTRRQAEALEAKLRNEIFDQADLGRLPVVPLPAAIQIWLRESVAGRKAEKATRSHALALGEHVEGKTVSDITKVADSYRAVDLAAATINRRLCVLKAVSKFAHRKGWIRENLSSQIPLLPEHNARHVYLTPEQVTRLLAAYDDERARAFAAVAIYTGMRRSEILRLQRSQIGRDVIDIGINTKTGAPRRIPIIPLLEPYLVHVPFSGSPHPLIGAFEKARARAGLRHVRLHDLRHTTASLLAIAGVDLLTIGRILGHSSTQTTARYSHLSDAALRNAMGALQGAFKDE
jgi:integrase